MEGGGGGDMEKGEGGRRGAEWNGKAGIRQAEFQAVRAAYKGYILTYSRFNKGAFDISGHGKEEDKWRRRRANTEQWLLKLKLFFLALWIYLLFEVFLGLFRIWNDLQTDENKHPLYITAK